MPLNKAGLVLFVCVFVREVVPVVCECVGLVYKKPFSAVSEVKGKESMLQWLLKCLSKSRVGDGGELHREVGASAHAATYVYENISSRRAEDRRGGERGEELRGRDATSAAREALRDVTGRTRRLVVVAAGAAVICVSYMMTLPHVFFVLYRPCAVPG